MPSIGMKKGENVVNKEYIKSYVKLSIKDVLNLRKEILRSRVFLLVGDYKIINVRVVGTISRVYEYKNRVELVISDETGELTVKVWSDKLSMIENLDKGQVVEVFGNLRVYKGTVYLNPDNIIRVPFEYLRLRALESKLIKLMLLKQYE